MISNFFSAYPVLAWSIVSTLVTFGIIKLLWEEIKWWWVNTWYGFPIIGKLNTLSKNHHKASENTGWYKSERTLCQDYKRFVPVMSEHDFNQRITYLNKAGDSGRSYAPLMLKILIVGFVVVEALGFSYVLAGFTIPGASESDQKLAAIGLSFLVAASCVIATHYAGHELYKSLKVRRARKDWVEDGGQNKLRSKSISVGEDQRGDDDQPEYTQITNRVGVDEHYHVTLGTLVFVLLIAAGATYVRVQTANKLVEDSVRIEKSELSAQQSAGNGLDLSGTATVPAADAAVNLDADKKAVEEAAQYDLHGYWVTFMILAVLFVFLQLLGVLFGYRWGFAGKNSEKAFDSTGRGKYLTYNDFRAATQKYIDQAQNQLEDLQQRMIRRHAEEGTGVAIRPNKTFLAFLSESEKIAYAHREEEKETQRDEEKKVRTETGRAKELNNKNGDAEHDRATPADSQPANPVSALTAVVTASDIASIVARIDSFGTDKEAKARYVDTLSDDVYAQVKQALKERKTAQDEKRKQRTAELEDLL